MKLQLDELPIGSPQMRRKTPKIAPLVALIILFTIPLYFPSILDSSKKLSDAKNTFESFITSHKKTTIPCSVNGADTSQCQETGGGGTAAQTHLRSVETEGTHVSKSDLATTTKELKAFEEKCDLFTGEWVPNPEGPYYTNETCYSIQQHQNCMKFGRPDLGFLKWRWKPDDCELPVFDPNRFLELVRGKSLAFVGDSVARNHMQSLICLLAKVARPVDLSAEINDQNRRYEYRDYDFNISMFWSPYLVKTGELIREPFTLYLDQFHHHWTTKIADFDYVIISAGHWFRRPTYFHVNNRRIGCLYCPDSNITQLTPSFSYRRASHTAFQAINSAAVGFNGVAIVRSFAPSHFEGGGWDSGGNCVRTVPFKRNETQMEDINQGMYSAQMEEYRIAEKGGAKFRLMDVTEAMMLRADGHPSKYGHWAEANRTFHNDCVHWCLPGPVDAWNDLLQEMIKREKKNIEMSE